MGEPLHRVMADGAGLRRGRPNLRPTDALALAGAELAAVPERCFVPSHADARRNRSAVCHDIR
jgi:hypothetical protein